MQASDDTLRQLVMAYEKSLSPDHTQRKAAEDFMKSIQAQPGFAAVVIKLMTATGLDNNVLQIAAIHFKNFVRNNWRPSEGSTDVIKIGDAEREQIKNTLVDLMVAVPPAVQRQVSETLSIISQSDFPQKWQNLLPALISKLNTQDPKILYGVLETANSIFKRYQHQFKSDAILEELKYILELFQEPLLKLFLSVNQLIEQNKSNPQVLPSLFEILHVILGLFYSLSFVDLPEYFEDHMKEWMEGFNRYLAFEPQYPELVSTNDEEEGVLQKVQAAICENINLYTTKYEEEFASFLPTFVGSVWNLLVKVGPQMKNDALVCSGMGFLTSVATSVHFALFNEQGAVQSIVEKIIIPNIKLREDDEEMFEMNPQEYIRRDIEGSDTDTRRRMASELIKGLRKQFELPLTQLFTAYIGTLLEQYKSNPEANWQAKDAALYLVTALTVSAATAAGGVTKTNQFVDVVNVFAAQVLPELQSAEVAHDILKADAFKFVTTFRNQLPREAIEGVFGLAVTSLESDSYVVQTYASIAVERLLLLKGADNAPVLGRAQLKAFLQPLVTNIFKVLSEVESKENSYIMKSLVRVIATSGEEVASIAEPLLRQLVSTLGGIYKNVGNVNFAHWLFEAISALITAVCPGNPAAIGAFEGQLFPAFQAILAEDVTELGPYVFQVLAYMLELRGTGAQQAYVALLPSLLMPVLWQRAGYQPPLVRLLQAYLNNAPQLILAQGHLQPILGVFQKLLSSSQSDHLAFFLLESIFLSLPFDQVQPFVANIFQLVFARIQSSKTLKIIRSFIVFLAFFIGKHGASTVLQAIDNVQPNLFMMVMSSLWLPNIQKVSGLTERKACAIAMIKLLTDCPALLGETYFSLWSKVLAALMAVLELPQDESAPADAAEEEVDVDIAQASHASFETLMHARKKDVDPFKDVDPKKLLAFSLQRLSQAHPGKFGGLVQQSLTPEALAALQSYFVAAGLNQPYLA